LKRRATVGCASGARSPEADGIDNRCVTGGLSGMAWHNNGAAAMNPARAPGPGAAQTPTGRQMHQPKPSPRSHAIDKTGTRTLTDRLTTDLRFQ